MPIYKTDKKQDGKQQYRVIVNYNNNGEYKKKEQRVFGYEAAVKLEHHMRIKYCQSMQEYGQMTFAEFFEEYINYKRFENRETTIDKCKQIVRNHILPYIGNVLMVDITPQTVLSWKNELNATNLGPTMKKNCYTQLHSVLNFALKIDAIHELPTNKIGNFRESYFKMPEEKIHYYTPEEFSSFARAARASINGAFQWEIYVFFCIAYLTGMRKGEIHALKWSDMDKGYIHVRRSISQKIAGKKYIETPPKNKASFRTLQIPAQLEAILKQHKARQKEEYPAWTTDYRVCGGDKCISDTTLANYNMKWADAANLRHIRIHDYRHSHASLLANEGVNIQEIARRLGHSDVQITWNRYSHLYPREEERAISVLNKIEI